MSKSRVPSLPKGANRATSQKFVVDARRYARGEFAKGASEAEVYSKLNKDGAPLPSLKAQLREEYLLFIGVTDSQIKGLRFFSGLAAMVFYGFLAGKIITDSPIFRYAMPAVLAIGVYMGIESTVIKFWKARKKPPVSN